MGDSNRDSRPRPFVIDRPCRRHSRSADLSPSRARQEQRDFEYGAYLMAQSASGEADEVEVIDIDEIEETQAHSRPRPALDGWVAMASSSSSLFSTKSSRLKTGTTLVPSTDAAACPLLFTDAVSECFCSFLEWYQFLELSYISKALRDEYDDKLSFACLGLRKDLPSASLYASVRRHKNIEGLEISPADLVLPHLLTCFRRGDLRMLKQLTFTIEISQNCVSTLADLLGENALPVLKVFSIDAYENADNVVTIMQAFQGGACPLLEELQIGIPFDNYYAPTEEEPSMERVERGMEAIASAFEIRAAAGTCQGLQYLLDEDWLTPGSVAVRTRLLRALLPSIKELPLIDRLHLDFAAAVKEIGAPYLEYLTVPRDVPPLVEAFSSMSHLRELGLDKGSLRMTSLDTFLALIHHHKRNFLPKFENLWLRDPFDNAADVKRLFDAVILNGAFASVKKISVICESIEGVKCDMLASVFSGGPLTGLSTLSLANVDGADGGFAALCHVLKETSCASTLKSLSLRKC